MKCNAVGKEEAHKILLEFLGFPLNDGLPILEKFAALPGAIFSRGVGALDRYVYIPGKGKHPVLLVAHVDTVWDKNYPWKNPGSGFKVEGDTIISASAKVGIGADDRAGCALLWLLKDSGHSLLLLDGEEMGAFGAKHLRRHDPELYKALNRHAYMLELDLSGYGLCYYCNLPVSRSFRRYIEGSFSCKPIHGVAHTDISCLARSVCGVNLSIGVEKQHSPNERLVLCHWLSTYQKLCDVLSRQQPVFRSSFPIRLRRFAGRGYRRLLGRLRNRGKG